MKRVEVPFKLMLLDKIAKSIKCFDKMKLSKAFTVTLVLVIMFAGAFAAKAMDFGRHHQIHNSSKKYQHFVEINWEAVNELSLFFCAYLNK